MKTFSVLNETNIVVNTIVAESKELAEQLTGLTCIENTEENYGFIGFGITEGIFIKPETTQHIVN